MKTRKLNIKKIIIFSIISLLFLILIAGTMLFFIYKINTSKVSNNSDAIIFEVSENNTFYSISDELKDNNLIKSEYFYKIYLKINKPTGLKAGIYSLRENMTVKEIIGVLSGDPDYNYGNISVTFKEGINMRKIASIIAENTDNTTDDVYNLLKDENYLDEIINKYWFVNDEIKDKNIYYSLEGYLFPDTYQLKEDMSVKEIFKIMLDTMDKKLSTYSSVITNSNYSIHEILTMASIIELESSNSTDRGGVAGVFYNRLKSNWTLGSDVTTYYAIKVDMNERDLYKSEINAVNSYNTRSSSMAGILPVGPIASPSIESIKAAINPTSHNYYYFVADKNGKTYFSKTYNEHLSRVSNLKASGLWYEY